MALPQQKPTRMTETEYLEFEYTSELKHEYDNGEIFAMSGASRAHNLIIANLVRVIGNQLLEKSCEVYPSDMRVQIESSIYTYPDVTVVCGDTRFAEGIFDTLLNPTVIMEILSPSTEAYDRGRKFRNYRKLASLREYVLVSQHMHHVERFLFQENGIWGFTDAEGPDATIDLSSIGCVLTLADVYHRVKFINSSDE